MEIRVFDPAETRAVVALWAAAGLIRPWNDPYRDIARKSAVQPELFLVAVAAGTIVGSVMAGYDGHRGWLNYLAVADSHRGTGIGRALIEHAEAGLLALGCPKVQLQVRVENAEAAAFYERLGYARYDVVDLGKRLIPDHTGPERGGDPSHPARPDGAQHS